ncbi:glycine--tRNA ligase [Methanobrevibacter cuticularis]|uniref:glycine--tRNA ligase n=1 Tax=Methanobrevibacter cuticularis TaxID=47311 RepID=A0A166EP44_9EURY|nr:glycine--tRNA ligase [Methanobrevibacter cuticularis]KZX16861.1 glycine--tRNA ligase [Methanobrevibacter cuticularis]
MNHEKMINISTKRGFLWPSFEIYSGVSGFTDYGPLGAILKNNIMQKWRKHYIAGEGFFEIESPTVTPEEVLKASGHFDNFTDPMTQCAGCGDVFRADHIIEETINQEVEGLTNLELDLIIKDHGVKCPNCGDKLSEIWNYNLMFKTTIGPAGNKLGFMRPETAQGIFITFKRLSRFFKNKLPFGVVQLGKAYRNEISPRQGVIRLREFTQAEAEIFVNPKNKTHPNFPKIADEKLVLNSAHTQIENKNPITITAQEALDHGIVANEILIYQIYLAKNFLKELGIPDDVLRFRQHLPNEMAHYAIDCWDVEVKTDRYGWVEIIGIADRGDYDLLAHSKHSNEDLNIFIPYSEPKLIAKTRLKLNMAKFGPSFKGDSPKVKNFLEKLDISEINEIKSAIKKEGKYIIEIESKTFEINSKHVNFEDIEEEVKGEKIVPHVIEPSFGIDRILYSVLLHSFHVSKNEDDKDYFKLANSIAPIQIGVFPLVNKEKLREKAIDITESLRQNGFLVEYDTSGTIGKRYARSDEIGVPIAITVDFDTLEDNTVTIRDRDTEKQRRVKIDNLKEEIISYFNDN